MTHAAPIELDYLKPGTPAPPGPAAKLILHEWPWWAWCGLATSLFIPLWYFTGEVFSPAMLYMWPLGTPFAAVILSIVFLLVAGLRAVIRWGVARRYQRPLISEARGKLVALLALNTYVIFATTPLGLLS